MFAERTGETPSSKSNNEDDETRWTRVIWYVVKEYNASTSLHGYHYLTEPGRHWLERLVWFAAQILAGWWAVVMILAVWQQYMQAPIVTTVASTHYPVWKVPFPAIALCNLNRISRSAARRVAQRLAAAPGATVDAESLFQRMRLLGRLYEPVAGADEAELEALHEELLRAFGQEYDVEALMRELTPTCKNLVNNCRWRGRAYPCSELFTTRATMDGFCCTFNYQRYADDFLTSEELRKALNESPPQPPRRLSGTGFQMGLTVVLDAQPWDYYYPLLPAHGIKVMIYNPRDFPDTASGGLVEQVVPVNADVFLRLESVTLESTEVVRTFSLSQRRCLFESEVDAFSGYYSYSDCLMDCRGTSIMTLCSCQPFFLPKRGKMPDCGLRDVPCLASYSSKWRTLRPPQQISGLEVEHQEALECPGCVPTCSGTSYHVQMTASYLQPDSKIDDTPVGNRSVVNIFFGSQDTTLLRQDELFTWYDLLSYFGGVCGFFVGFSLISVVEVFYFFTFRLALACSRGGRPASPPPNTGSTLQVTHDIKTNLYWREMANRAY